MTADSAAIVQRLWNYCNVLRDESLDDSATLPHPGVLAAEIVEDLRTILAQVQEIADDLAADETAVSG